MKAINCVFCVLVIACLAGMAHSEISQNQVQQDLLDALTTDESLKVKRPFCNAFTGCGKKRNFQENSVYSQDTVASGSVRLPLSVYKALLKAAAQNIHGTIDRDTNGYRLSGIPQAYEPRMSLNKRLDIPPTLK